MTGQPETVAGQWELPPETRERIAAFDRLLVRQGGIRLTAEGFRLLIEQVSNAVGERLETEVRAARAEAFAEIRRGVEGLRRAIDVHTDACSILRRASEGGAETDLDSAVGKLEALLP